MMNTTMAMTTMTTTLAPAAVVTGCIAATFTNADAVIANSATVTALKEAPRPQRGLGRSAEALAALITGVTADYITALTLTKGGACGRRLEMEGRFLQTAEAVTIDYAPRRCRTLSLFLSFFPSFFL